MICMRVLLNACKRYTVLKGKGERVMLKFILSKIVGTICYYLYFPEGNENAAGTIAIDFENDKMEVITESKDDFECLYAMHAMNGIEKGQIEGTVAWY